MKPSWLIAVPAWGERYRKVFVDHALPAIRAAVDCAGIKPSFIIHTDDARHLGWAMRGLGPVEFRNVPHGDKPHRILGLAHQEAIESAKLWQRVALLCADIVPSIECFAAAEQRFDDGKRLIMMAGTRTIDTPPIGARSRDLLAWAMQHRHPITVDCFWGEGRAKIAWAIYFQRGDDIALRAFHLHPFAMVKDCDIAISRTVDWDLATAFTDLETHIVTDADDMALVEMSPPDFRFKLLGQPMNVATVADWASKNTIPLHREFFRKHSITIAGRGDCGEQAICDDIIARI